MEQVSQHTLTIVDSPPRHLDEYEPIVPEVVEEIRELAKPFEGLSIAHVNATALGGGVAEMLRYLVPLQVDVGFDSKWYVIPPSDPFFEVTKSIHNYMQGKEGGLSEEQKTTYLDHNELIAGLLAKVEADILIMHDPQPAAALSYFADEARSKLTIWRCHIDTSHPNKSVWNFLRPYLQPYDQYVFTMPEYSNQDFPNEKVNLITPVIDPLSDKNVAMDRGEARKYLEQFGIDSQKPLITQVSRFDPWKDPEGVIDAFRILKKEFPQLQLAMVAQMASDDPEGVEIYEQVKAYAGGEEGIFLLVNLPDNDIAVNAFQSGSDVVLQKSIREGFGLTVTEAMWKGAVLVGGNVGGIRKQIEDGINGFLVNSPEEAAEKVAMVLRDPDLKEGISRAAHESVKSQFLMPHKLRNYLKLFQAQLG
jgi:trehalose synthase